MQFIDEVWETVKDFVVDNLKFCFFAVLYFVVMIVSNIYSPWYDISLTQSSADIIESTLFFGFSDILQIMAFCTYQAPKDMVILYVIVFALLFNVQKLVLPVILHDDDDSFIKNILQDFLTDNILFYVSAVIWYLITPKIQSVMNMAIAGMDTHGKLYFILMILIAIVLGIIVLFVVLTSGVYLSFYIFALYKIFDFIEIIDGKLHLPSVLQTSVLCVIAFVGSVVVGILAEKILKLSAKIIAGTLGNYISFFDDFADFLDDI